jgi:hypothetical protein
VTAVGPIEDESLTIILGTDGSFITDGESELQAEKKTDSTYRKQIPA